MLGAIGGMEGAIWYRPVERAAPVGPRDADPRAQPAVSDEEGKPLSEPAPSLESLSRDKRRLLAELRGELAAKQQELLQGGDDAPSGADAGPSESPSGDAQLSDEEQAAVEELKARDREVRAHEQAHAAVGGQYVGAPSYEYQVGPDGKRYAIGGEVKIDASPIPGDPEATEQKMRVVERAAMAPAEPSPQDRKVAQAARAEAQAASAEAAAQSASMRRGERGAEQSAQQTARSEAARAGYAAASGAFAFTAARPSVAFAA